jgi:AraC family transcriptional regulator of adaptative response / DNA-3-methyladenine glycosylase II
VANLARAAAERISAGVLDGGTVKALAAELGVSDRQLRRAMERELGSAPLDLAQAQRLLRARQLLTDTTVSVTQIAYASGFQSLRRFNAAFRERYQMSPSDVRRRENPRLTREPT